MLTNSTTEGLKSLRLPAMASGLLEQREHPDYAGLSFEERLGLLVDAELLQRQNRRLERVLSPPSSEAAPSSKTWTSPTLETRQDHVPVTGQLTLGAESPQRDDRRTDRRGQDLPRVRARPQRHPQRSQCALRARATAARRPQCRPGRWTSGSNDGHARENDVLILDDLLLRPLSDDQAADLLEVVEDRRVGRSSPHHNYPSVTGTRGSATRRSPTQSSTGC